MRDRRRNARAVVQERQYTYYCYRERGPTGRGGLQKKLLLLRFPGSARLSFWHRRKGGLGEILGSEYDKVIGNGIVPEEEIN